MFGYQNQRNGDGYVHRVIDEREAAVVRRIFTMYAEGAGLVRIAKTLNADHVPVPRKAMGSWAPTAVRDMLRRPLYAGVLVWNKTQRVMRRGTEGQRKRPEHEWVSRPAPDLAIIDEALWQRVQARLAESGATYLRRMDGRLIGVPPAPTWSPRIYSPASRSAGSAAVRSSR